jgi:flagellin
MALTVNTNVASLNAQRHVGKANSNMKTSLERLSSGLRINSAKDDAAGLAISERMTSQVRGLNQAVRNANDGISVTQVAEGALQESTSILQRMRELAVQGANEVLTADDRTSIQKEVTALQSELTRIAEKTDFNGTKMLDGTFGTKAFQVGSNSNETITLSIGSAKSADLGRFEAELNSASATAGIGSVAAATAGTATTNTVTVDADAAITANEGSVANIAIASTSSAKEVADDYNVQTATTGVNATAFTGVKLAALSAAGTVSFTLNTDGAAATEDGTASVISASVGAVSDLSSLADAINDKSSLTGVTAYFDADSKSEIILESSTGKDITITAFTNTAGTGSTMTADRTTAARADAGEAAVTLTSGGTNSTRAIGTVSLTAAGSNSFVTSGNDATVDAGTTASFDNVGAQTVTSTADANDMIDVLDSALQQVSNSRADLGAVANRLESTISNLMNVSENVSAARSRIRDVDFASETAEMTKSNILQQAGVAMLSQANSLPQAVLSLLQ